jgi:cation diffusion facilitator CzcD-associated flavoprotein CzcO
VLVVSPDCSGMEIAHDIATAGAAKVWLAVRTPPTILSREGPGAEARGSRPALRWLHKPPGCARLHVHASERSAKAIAHEVKSRR